MPAKPAKSAAVASAARAEVTGELLHFTYDGEEYAVPDTSRWPLEVIDAIEEGAINGALRQILGDEQWTKFRSKPRVVADLSDMFAALSKGVGIAGN